MLSTLLKTINPNVIVDLFAEAKRRREGQDPQVRTLILISGGGASGAIGAAQMEVLFEHGLDIAVDKIYGQSTGAAIASYATSKDSLEIGKKNYEEFVSGARTLHSSGRRFFEGRKLITSPNEAVDIPGLMETLKFGPYPIKFEALSHAPHDTYIMTTNSKTGELVSHSVKEMSEEKFWQVLEASMTIPGLTKNTQRVGDEFHTDGGIDQLPAEHIIKESGYNPRDVNLIVLPHSKYPGEIGLTKVPLVESLVMKSAKARKVIEPEVVSKFARRRDTFKPGASYTKNIFVLWSPSDIPSLGATQEQIISAEQLAANDLRDLLTTIEKNTQ